MPTKKKYLVAFIVGALMALAMPPIGAFYILLICVPTFILLTNSCETKRSSFLTGWAFGAGYFICSLYWVSMALFVDIASFWWVLPLSLIIAPTILGLYYGLIPLLAWRYKANKLSYIIITITAWSAIEYIRGFAFTGFPWNLAGYTWHFSLPIMQINAYIGIYGLTFLTLLWASTPIIQNKRVRNLLIMSFVIASITGLLRLHMNPTETSEQNVRIVQANIAQNMKWDKDTILKNFKQHLDLTSLPSTDAIDFTVWPETSIVTNNYNAQERFDLIAKALPNNSIGVIGALNTKYKYKEAEFFNSITFINKQGAMIGNYSKHHLVPFGEYIPYREYLGFIKPLATTLSMIGDFTRGTGVSTINLNGKPNPSPLVCYEGIFPRNVALQGDDRPDWLVNSTNDGWYGNTSGPYQHLEITRVRAIEEGLPLVRAANTGISAVVDPMGRIIAHKELGDKGVVDSMLPKPVSPTLYSQYGNVAFLILLLLAGVFSEVLIRRKVS